MTAYLFTALRRAAGRSAERRARGPALSAAAVDSAAAAEDPRDDRHQCGERLQRAMLALPPEQREVMSLKIDGELTFGQIAEVIGVSMNTAASRYRYALEKLRKELETQESLKTFHCRPSCRWNYSKSSKTWPRGPRGGPSQELKRRCLQDLQSELRRQRRECRWAFAAAIAASLLVGLNLSLSAVKPRTLAFGLTDEKSPCKMPRKSSGYCRLCSARGDAASNAVAGGVERGSMPGGAGTAQYKK